MLGSSSTTSRRASACTPASLIDVFMMTIFARFAEGNLNVSSGTAVVFQPTPGRHRDGRCRWAAWTASVPADAVITSNPAYRRDADRSSRMFGSSSTTSSRASAGAPASVIDEFMITIFAHFTEGNLNVSSGTAVAFQRTPCSSPPWQVRSPEVISGHRPRIGLALGHPKSAAFVPWVPQG